MNTPISVEQIRELRATWNAIWEDDGSNEDIAYLGIQINSLADQVGVDDEEASHDDSQESR